MKRGSHSKFPIISRHPFIVSAWLHVSQKEIVEGLALVRGMRCAPFTADVCTITWFTGWQIGMPRRRMTAAVGGDAGIVESSALEGHLGVPGEQKQIKVFKYLPHDKAWRLLPPRAISMALHLLLPSICRMIRRMTSGKSKQGATMTHYYCKYCGQKFPTISSLTSGRCIKHPDGSYEGRHALYEGSEKSQYACKYCGQKFSTISSLTSGKCIKHPDGSYKGRHSPAL